MLTVYFHYSTKTQPTQPVQVCFFPQDFGLALHAIFLRGWKLNGLQSHLPTTLSFLTSQCVRVPPLSFSPSMVFLELNLLSGGGGVVFAESIFCPNLYLLVPTILICLYIPAHTLELGAYDSKKVFRWIVSFIFGPQMQDLFWHCCEVVLGSVGE